MGQRKRNEGEGAAERVRVKGKVEWAKAEEGKRQKEESKMGEEGEV